MLTDTFTVSGKGIPAISELTNNGHSAQLDIEHMGNFSFILSYLGTNYSLQQLHFHWGHNDKMVFHKSFTLEVLKLLPFIGLIFRCATISSRALRPSRLHNLNNRSWFLKTPCLSYLFGLTVIKVRSFAVKVVHLTTGV